MCRSYKPTSHLIKESDHFKKLLKKRLRDIHSYPDQPEYSCIKTRVFAFRPYVSHLYSILLQVNSEDPGQ